MFSVIMVISSEPIVYIEQCLKSLRNSTQVPDSVYIAIDGVIRDDVLQILDNYPLKISIYNMPYSVGLASCLNYLADQLDDSFEYVARMDPDDFVHANRFQKQLEFLKNHPDIDILGCNAWIVDNLGNKVRSYADKVNNPVVLDGANVSIHPTWMIRSTILQQLRYPEIPVAQDFAFLSNCMISQKKVWVLPEKLFYYRVHSSSVSSQKRYLQLSWKIKIFHNYRRNRLTTTDESVGSLIGEYWFNILWAIKERIPYLKPLLLMSPIFLKNYIIEKSRR